MNDRERAVGDVIPIVSFVSCAAGIEIPTTYVVQMLGAKWRAY